MSPASTLEGGPGRATTVGVIAAVDNGDATSFEPFQAAEHKAYNGLALVIVRTRAGAPGAITVRLFTR